MLHSKPRQAALTGSVLLLQAAVPLPALAIQPAALAEAPGTAAPFELAAPLDSTALGAVTTLISGGPIIAPARTRSDRPGLIAGTAENSSQIAQSPTVEISNRPVSVREALDDFMQSDSHGIAGNAQDATSVTLTGTLNGTTNITFIRQ